MLISQTCANIFSFNRLKVVLDKKLSDWNTFGLITGSSGTGTFDTDIIADGSYDYFDV